MVASSNCIGKGVVIWDEKSNEIKNSSRMTVKNQKARLLP